MHINRLHDYLKDFEEMSHCMCAAMCASIELRLRFEPSDLLLLQQSFNLAMDCTEI